MARVLIIDDEPLVRRGLRRILETAGYTIAEAGDGAAGLVAYLAAPPDAVICDMVMPHQDGIATLRALRAASPSVRLIAMSGGGRTSGTSLLDLASDLGAAAILVKPASKALVLEVVAAVLRGDAPA